MMISLECEFWAVGQGLFSSGKILSGGNTAFSWVYDCGAVKKSRSALVKSIREMRKSYQDNIDLVVLSHFDEDHISGISELLKHKQVTHLVLPYFPLWQRLVVALEQGISTDNKLFSFYLNPVEYIWQECREAFGANSHILLLPSLDDEIDFPIEPQDDEEQWNELSNDIIDFNLNLPIRLLPKGWAISRSGIEFVPYNAPLFELKKYPQNWDSFRQSIEQIVKNTNYQQADIEKIKAIYDVEFTRINKKGKKNSEDRNAISTFLYVGARQKLFAQVRETSNVKRVSVYDTQMTKSYFLPKDEISNAKNGILYTGDGYLKSQEQFDQLTKVLGAQRIENIFCFQALHHGSKHNWHKGLADKISPCLTVFSADHNYVNYKHPHQEVVKDFLPYLPILVNQHSYLRLGIQYFSL